MEIVAEKPANTPEAYARYYSELADYFASLISLSRPKIILEAGCGKGQLTIPLLNRLPQSATLLGVDSSRGPYAGWLEELEGQMAQTGLIHRVRLVKADVRQMRGVKSASVDMVVSNELLCDLPKERLLEAALHEFHRVLRPRGSMIHGEWASYPANHSKSFIAMHRPSWSPDQLFSATRNAGFRDFRLTYFDSTVRFGYEAAVHELRNWGTSDSNIRRNVRVLKRHGLTLPFEHVIQCRK